MALKADQLSGMQKKYCRVQRIKLSTLLNLFVLNIEKGSKKYCGYNCADIYYCAKGSFDYMLADGLFPLRDVKVLFQDFQPKAYPQIG